MKRIRNRNIFILLTIILSLGITLGAVYFMYQYKDSRENELKTGMISLNFTEKSEVINLSSNVPMIDNLGLKSRPYEFTITNTSEVPIMAKIKVNLNNTNTINLGAVRYALYINNEKVIKDYIHSDTLTIYTYENMNPGETINCKLYFWIDYYYDRPNEVFSGKIYAEGESIDIIYKEANFLSGKAFNVKIKELAGTDTTGNVNGYEVEDNNIIYIKKAKELPNNITFTDDNILSTNNSEVPIYGWFDSGTLFYYTFASKLFLNSDSSNMFRGLINVNTIDLNNIDSSKSINMSAIFMSDKNLLNLNLLNFNTSNVENMSFMFYQCQQIENLDLRNFDTSNVNNMHSMFYDCKNLKVLNIANFNTVNVKNMKYMFMGCKSLISLDINSFDMSNVEDVGYMFHLLQSIQQLKTPKVYPSSLTIDLPKTLYDSSHNAYTSLNSTSPTETWLKSE